MAGRGSFTNHETPEANTTAEWNTASPATTRARRTSNSGLRAAVQRFGEASGWLVRPVTAVVGGGVAGDFGRQSEPPVDPGQACGDDRADGQVGVGGLVEALDLDVGRLRSAAGHAGDEPRRGLAILVPRAGGGA